MTSPARPPTPERLRRYALHHLERFDSPSAGLRRVLLRRVEKAVRAGLVEKGALEPVVDRIVSECVAAGLVDDARYAEAAVRRLRARGASARKVRAWLDAKGLDRALVERSLGEEEAVEPELDAALALARRRRLGPFRREPVDAEGRRRELGVLARAGFGYALARRVVDAASEEEVSTR